MTERQPLNVRSTNRVDRVAATVTSLMLALMLALTLGFLATLFHPWQPMEKLEIRVLNQPTVGGNVIVNVEYCKRIDWSPREVRWSLINDVTVILEPTTAYLPVGCHNKVMALHLVDHVGAGIYQLQMEEVYTPWPWREIRYVRTTKPFVLR